MGKKEVAGMHQTGVAYKQLPPNQKSLVGVEKSEIEALPPIDHVPITSAVTAPEPNSTVQPGTALLLSGYAYSGAGLAVIRVDVSIDGGSTWAQADIQRPCERQHVRSGRAWAWIQWKYATTVPQNASGTLISCARPSMTSTTNSHMSRHQSGTCAVS